MATPPVRCHECGNIVWTADAEPTDGLTCPGCGTLYEADSPYRLFASAVELWESLHAHPAYASRTLHPPTNGLNPADGAVLADGGGQRHGG